MTGRTTSRLILWICCAHALVHAYELSLPAAEQAIAREYFPDEPSEGKKLTGLISTSWRMTWGFGALLAGWLVDRYGSRAMLAAYLLGCSILCWVVATSTAVWALFAAMIMMGSLASIYHPAGLTLISHITTPQSRPRALGLHGVFGSAGIGLTPLFAGQIFSWGGSWRDYYFLLGFPGLLLGLFFVWQTFSNRQSRAKASVQNDDPDDENTHWHSFFTLVCVAALQGFVYSALLSFLPRYLSGADPNSASDTTGNYWAGPTLLVGCIGQFLAGSFAKPVRLEKQFMAVTFGNIPPLVWMAVASGWQRPVAAGLFALIHFMHQPIYNSLIAKYTPRSRRSLCYGFSFAMGLGLGGVGASFNGFSHSDSVTYLTLATVAAVAGCGCLILVSQNRRRQE